MEFLERKFSNDDLFESANFFWGGGFKKREMIFGESYIVPESVIPLSLLLLYWNLHTGITCHSKKTAVELLVSFLWLPMSTILNTSYQKLSLPHCQSPISIIVPSFFTSAHNPNIYWTKSDSRVSVSYNGWNPKVICLICNVIWPRISAVKWK